MNKKGRVCHITTIHPSKDVRIFHKECVSLADQGYEVTLLVGNGEDDKYLGVSIKGVRINYSGRAQRLLRVGKALYKAAIAQNADVYHFHDPEFLRFAVRLSNRTGAKVVYDAHEDVPRQLLDKYYLPKWFSRSISGLVERYENSIVSRLDAVITADDKVTERFEQINPNVICVKNYAKLSGSLDPTPFSQKERKVCHIGSLTENRGIIELIMAMEDIEGTLELAGAFSTEELQERVSRLPGWKKVNYHGYVSRKEVQKILRISMVGTVTLHPIEKYLDALPVKLFEYMAAGLAVVSSNIPMWELIVRDANCGMTVDPFNPAQIASAVNGLLNDPETAEKYGLNGRKAVEKKYSWATEEKKLLELYRGLLPHR